MFDVALKGIINPLADVTTPEGPAVIPNGRMCAEVCLTVERAGVAVLVFDLDDAEEQQVEEIIERATHRYLRSLKLPGGATE